MCTSWSLFMISSLLQRQTWPHNRKIFMNLRRIQIFGNNLWTTRKMLRKNFNHWRTSSLSLMLTQFNSDNRKIDSEPLWWTHGHITTRCSYKLRRETKKSDPTSIIKQLKTYKISLKRPWISRMTLKSTLLLVLHIQTNRPFLCSMITMKQFRPWEIDGTIWSSDLNCLTLAWSIQLIWTMSTRKSRI